LPKKEKKKKRKKETRNKKKTSEYDVNSKVNDIKRLENNVSKVCFNQKDRLPVLVQ